MATTVLKRLAQDERGVSAIIIALGLTSILGFAGLAIDVSIWYADKRSAQGAADSAAYSAALDYMKSGSTSFGTATAKAVATKYGFTNGSGGVTVTINSPPTSGTHQTTGAYEVIIQKTETLALASLFTSSAAIAARAVASPGSTGGNECVLALDPGSGTTVTLQGNPSVDLSKCGMQVNGTGSAALSLGGNAHMNAKYLNVVGGVSVNKPQNLTVTNETLGAQPLTNPYASLTVAGAEADPSLSGKAACPTGSTYSGGSTISPGYYCGGLSLNGGTVTMAPGVYVISGGSLTINGNVTLNGTGVTFVLTGSGSNYATAKINGTATVNLTAPTSGATSGVVFYGDPAAPAGTESDFLGNATMNITGALDFPTGTVGYTGNSSTATCTQIVAYDITFKGDSGFSNNCTGTGTTAIGATTSQIVE